MASEQELTPNGKGDPLGEDIIAMGGTRAELNHLIASSYTRCLTAGFEVSEAARSLIVVMYCLPRSERM